MGRGVGGACGHKRGEGGELVVVVVVVIGGDGGSLCLSCFSKYLSLSFTKRNTLFGIIIQGFLS